MLRAGYRAVCTENFSYSMETDSEDAWLADTGGNHMHQGQAVHKIK